jgi:hypothetical protein
MGSYSTRLAWETLRTLDSATFVSTYLKLGTPLLNPSYICKLVNNSNVLVTISIDGATDIDVAPANSFWLYDEGKGQEAYQLSLPKGTQIFVRGPTGTGLVYLVTQYITTI